MADARGPAVRGRPRGGGPKAKPSPRHHHKQLESQGAVVLPKLKISNNHNNNNNSPHDHPPFSPRVGEIPVALPMAPRPPPPNRAVALAQPSIEPHGPSSGSFESAKTAWSTPRSPVPESPSGTGPLGSSSTSTSSLAAFFQMDGTTPTPARLLSVEESLLASQQLYHVDWARLRSDNDKYLEIAATASSHLETIQAELQPALQATSHETQIAVVNLARGIESLHGAHASEREKLLDQMDQLFTQQTDDKLALVDARVLEKQALEKAHDQQIQEIQAQYQEQMQKLEAKAKLLETNCFQEIQQLKARMANELASHTEQAKKELADFRACAEEEKKVLMSGSSAEIDELRTTSQRELETLRSSSQTAYVQLLTSSQQEIHELKSSSASELERVLQCSASTLAEVTETLASELQATKAHAESQLATATATYELQKMQLEQAAASQVAQLTQQHDSQVELLQGQWTAQVSALSEQLQARERQHTMQVTALTTRATAELTASKATSQGEKNALVQQHTRELARLHERHERLVKETVASYEAQLGSLKQSHSEQIESLQVETSQASDSMAKQYEKQLVTLRDDAKLDKERLVLHYESQLELLRRVTADQVTKAAKERDDAIHSLRETHALRVLQLETTLRESEKSNTHEKELLTEKLLKAQRSIEVLTTSELFLQRENLTLVERASEERTRFEMQLEESQAEMVGLKHAGELQNGVLETLKRDLRTAEEAAHTKSNTILELTFVIKSRDEQIEKLHGALLDTIQNVNSKTEILEITAENLSTKAKELEDTKAALRMESGRLSRVEEDVHHKVELLEDSTFKMENMQLQMENLRFELKKLQMEMKLQFEHSSGELELKQGEIRRSYAFQNELKQKNEFSQEEIVRLEASLAASTRQGEELRRRVELLKVETSQRVGDANQLSDLVVEREKQLVVMAGEKQALVSTSQSQQLQLGNAHSKLQKQKEQLEKLGLELEDVHCQYQRRLEMTSAQKDERQKYEKQLLLLELGTLKETLKKSEEVGSQLEQAQAVVGLLEKELKDAKQQLQEKEVERVEGGEKKERLQSMVTKTKEEKERLEQVLAQRESESKEADVMVNAVRCELAVVQQKVQEKEQEAVEMRKELENVQGHVEMATKALEDQKAKLQEKEAERLFQEEQVARLKETLAQSERLYHEKNEELQELQSVCQAHEQAHRQAQEEAHHHLERETELEAACLKLDSETQRLSQVQEETTAQIEYLVAALKKEQHAHAMSREHVEGMIARERAVLVQEKKEMKTKLCDADAGRRLQIEALEAQLVEMAATMTQRIQQVEQAKADAVDALRVELIAQGASTLAAAQRVQEGEVALLKDEQEKHLLAMEKEWKEKDEQAHGRLATAANEVAGLEAQLTQARLVCEGFTQEIVDLKCQIDDKNRVLTENNEVLRLRKATIENVRKEMTLLMELHKPVGNNGGGDRGEDGGEGGGGAGGGGRGPSDHSLEQTLTLIKQQLETFVNEEFHVLEFPNFALANHHDLQNLLKEFLRMRCCLSAIGKERVLSVDDVCGSLRSLERILSTVDEVDEEQKVMQALRDHRLVQGELSKVLQVATDAQGTVDVLRAYGPVFAVLNDMDGGSGTKCVDDAAAATSRAAALVHIVDDYTNVKAAEQHLLVAARTKLACETIHTLSDLAPLLDEAEFLRQRVDGGGGQSADEATVLSSTRPQSELLRSSHIVSLLDERASFLVEISNELEWPQPQTSGHVVDAVHNLVKVVHAFESLASHTSSARPFDVDDDDSSRRSVAARTQAVIGFVDELKLLSQFAQNILDEEADATTISMGYENDANRSHSSSSSSLLSLRAALTRTPTPTTDLDVVVHTASSSTLVDGSDSSVPMSTGDLVLELLLSGDALAPSAVDDGDSAAPEPCPSAALSDSLIDISLVMNDHYRILSEAAHWVGKAQSMSPRNKNTTSSSSTGSSSSGSMDFAAELVRLVRDHCTVLSLSRRLFRLQDPRHDVATVLQCLAVLTRLTSRLQFFSPSLDASDSSESLQSQQVLEAAESKLKTSSLSVFASMDEMAHHLQDYDAFIRHMLAHHRQWTSVDATVGEGVDDGVDDGVDGHYEHRGRQQPIENIDSLLASINSRLGVVDKLAKALGLQNPVDELPLFVASLQSLVVAEDDDHQEQETQALGPMTASMETVLAGVQQAFCDRETLHEMLQRMRETLPFASTVESPQELLGLLKETLAQCETLLVAKQDAEERVQPLERKVDEMEAQSREEDRVLAMIINEVEPTGSKLERLGRLVDEIQELRELAKSIAAEETLLADAGFSGSAGMDRLDSVQALIAAVGSLQQEKTELEAYQRQVQASEQEDRAFLSGRGVMWQEGEARRVVEERLLEELTQARAQEHRHREELAQEVVFLATQSVAFDTHQNTHTARLAVYKKFLDDHQMAGKRSQESERTSLALQEELEELTSHMAAEKENHQRDAKQEMAFLQAHGVVVVADLSDLAGRLEVYETLLKRVETAKQTLEAWEGSPHRDARGCQGADADHAQQIQKLEAVQQQETAKAVQAALQQQSQQIVFRGSLVSEEDTPPSSSSSSDGIQTAELMETFTKRDNIAIGMIYRLIRLATDILNTSAFSSSSDNGGAGGAENTLPVEHTQSVMVCVKELKSLKEFLLQSLEQILRDHKTFSSLAPPVCLRRESLQDRDTAVDWALLLHRDHVACVTTHLLQSQAKIQTQIQRLHESLAQNAGLFPETQVKTMKLEIALAAETTFKQHLEAKFDIQEQFLTSFTDEQKQIEATLRKDLEKAKQQLEELAKKMEMLEKERHEANAMAPGSAGNSYGTPRTPSLSSAVAFPTRPDKPRELTSSRIKTAGNATGATGTTHKEKFVSDLEKETGQRKPTTKAAPLPPPASASGQRRLQEWKRHELLTSSDHMEQQFRAMNDGPSTTNYMAINSSSSNSFSNSSSDHSHHHHPQQQQQELWYQGVRLLQHISFFVSVFYVPKQKMLRVEIFNSETEQQQTIYVTIDELQGFLHDSKRAQKLKLTLNDPAKYGDVIDVLFERVKLVGGGDSTNVLFAFQ